MTDVFVHSHGICESDRIGAGTRVWAFAHVLPGAVIGVDCNICDHVFVENDVVVGDRVTIKSGVQVWDGVRLADDVFVGPNVTFTNDRFPRSKVYPDALVETCVGPGASLGANATILPGVKIGRGAMVGAGAVVTKDVPPYAIIVGNPARIVGYVGASSQQQAAASAASVQPPDITVSGVRLIKLRRADDLRGSLVAAEFSEDLPFVPQRVFVVFQVPTREVRGEHAHRLCEQVLVCLNGSVSCITDDGSSRQEFVLDGPETGLYVPAMIWATQYEYSADAIVLVLSSRPYEPDDYIRDYEQYLSLRASNQD